MTCREKIMTERPEDVDRCWVGGVAGCPHHAGYLPKPEGCPGEKSNCDVCRECWDREIPEPTDNTAETVEPHIKDSGNRRKFESGAVRDIQEGKGRCDLMPLDVIGAIYEDYFPDQTYTGEVFTCIHDFIGTGDIYYLKRALDRFMRYTSYADMFLEVAKHFEEGAKKYGENNWQKGIPVRCYIDSAVRHYLKHLRGDTDEPHDRAFCWNIMCAIWTCVHKPELNDYRKE